MLDRVTIARRTGPGEEYSFQNLRQEGVALLQELSGKIWTDYNLHDPGVTILEQLCYALTDLIYRTDFDTADYLTGEDGKIDFNECALYRPEDILPSGPVSINDYRKIFFDGIPDIDNVWVKLSPQEDVPGLYRVYIQLTEEAETRGESEVDQVKGRIRQIFAANRNLGEDLEVVTVAKTLHYSLHGTVEVDGERNTAEVLAEIYFRASRYVSASIPFRSFQEIRDRGDSLNQIFTGPLTHRVHIEDEELGREIEALTISELNGIIGEIEGVSQVGRLCFKNGQEETQDIPYNPIEFVPHLSFPGNDDELGVKLYENERELGVSLREVRRVFDRLNLEYRLLRQIRQDFRSISATPAGEYRKLNDYYSVQNHFPDNYGINRYGVPGSEPPRRRAQAKQLKAYLLFFEQVMANYLENLQGISRLFSRDDQLDHSYSHHVFTDQEVPNITGLYAESETPLGDRIAQIISKYDNFNDRRSRVLDYLLAIYGERFPRGALRRFNYYYTAQELEQEMLRNKLNLLKLIGGSI